MRPSNFFLLFALVSSTIFWCTPSNDYLAQTHVDLVLMAREQDPVMLYELIEVGCDFDRYLTQNPTSSIQNIQILEVTKFDINEIIMIAQLTENLENSVDQRDYFIKLFLISSPTSPTGYIII